MPFTSRQVGGSVRETVVLVLVLVLVLVQTVTSDEVVEGEAFDHEKHSSRR